MSSRIWLSCLMYTNFLYTFVGYQGTPAESDCVFHNIYNMTSLGSTIYKTTDEFQWTYSFNPCTSFKKGKADQGDCQSDVAICRWTSGSFQKVGTKHSRKFRFDEQTMIPKLQYSGSRRYSNWKCTVLLNCDSKEEEGIFDISSYKGSTEIVFSLTHKCACPNGCLIGHLNPTQPSDSTDNIVIETVPTAAGAVILIALVVFVWLRVRRRRIVDEYPPLVGDNRRNEGEVHQNDFSDVSDGSELTSGSGSTSFRSLTTPSSSGRLCSDITSPNKKDDLNNKIKRYTEEPC